MSERQPTPAGTAKAVRTALVLAEDLRRDVDVIHREVQALHVTLHGDHTHVGLTEQLRTLLAQQVTLAADQKKRQDRLWTVVCGVAGTLLAALITWVVVQSWAPTLTKEDVQRLLQQWETMPPDRRGPPPPPAPGG